MGPIDPIVAHQSDPPRVSALERVDPTHREGRGGSGQGRGRRRRTPEDQVGDLDLQASHRDLQDAVLVTLDGVSPDGPQPAPELVPAAGEDARPHVDLTA